MLNPRKAHEMMRDLPRSRQLGAGPENFWGAPGGSRSEFLRRSGPNSRRRPTGGTRSGEGFFACKYAEKKIKNWRLLRLQNFSQANMRKKVKENDVLVMLQASIELKIKKKMLSK